VDILRRDDIERARKTPPEVKALQALEMMRLGIRLKRDALKRQFPSEEAEAIEARLRRWLASDE
jgi:hypothetical protein